jgi:hypothetical protein
MADTDLANRARRLSFEQRQLQKAGADIEQGRTRLRDQEALLDWLEAAGRDTRQAERLAYLFQGTLAEWERHRTLIEQRVACLEKELAGS